MSISGLISDSRQLQSPAVLAGSRTDSVFIEGPRTEHVIIGNRQLHSHLAEIRQLRRRCGQEDDLTTEPEYFMAANTLANRRCAAVLIRRDRELEACVLLFEHTRAGMGLGLFRGGDYVGECLVAGREDLRVQYVHLATQALMRQWRVHGISLSVKAAADVCMSVMGPASHSRRFCGIETQYKLPLASTYEGMLASMGPRTRRSLAGKRHQLEKSANVQFVPALQPGRALAVMLELETKATPQRISEFFVARHSLLRSNSNFFSMGLRLPAGPWLSLLTGWRLNGVTYVDLQMNDTHYKKESISAVMRAFMLEHEIGRRQNMIYFVGGSSVLLRRYCEPIEHCTEIFLAKPCLRTSIFERIARHVQEDNVYVRLKPGATTRLPDEAESCSRGSSRER